MQKIFIALDEFTKYESVSCIVNLPAFQFIL